MDEKMRLPVGIQVLITGACLVVIVAGMQAADALVVPFLLAVFFAIICSPPLFWLRKIGLPTFLATLVVAVGVVGIGIALSLFIGQSLTEFFQKLPAYQSVLQEKTTGLMVWLSSKGVDVNELNAAGFLEAKSLMKYISNALSGVSKLMTNTFVIMLTMIFILLEAAGMPEKLRAAAENPEESISRFSQITESVKQYLAIKTLCSLLTGVLVGVFLTVLGVNEAVLWGFFAFLLNYIPNIGSIIASVPGILVALIQFGAAQAVYVAAGYMVINISISNFIEPKFMGRGLGLSTLVVFISLVFWGWVLGPVGMLLSVLLTTILKIAFESSEETRWIAILLGPASVAKKEIEKQSIEA